MNQLPRTPAQYYKQVGDKLNWLEKLRDDASSTDERLDVTNHLLIELVRQGGEVKPDPAVFPPALSRAIMDHLTKDKPETYKYIDIDLSEARTNKHYPYSGDYIGIDNMFARGEVTLKLNEESNDAFDLRRQKHIRGQFYRFFITNVAGQGVIRLFVSEGYRAASEPVESITRAELAARLGSPVTFDRRGDVIWFDDFANGVNAWTLFGSGTNNAQAWSAEGSRHSGFCLKLTTGSTTPLTATATTRLAYPTPSRMGIEYAFQFDSNISEILLRNQIWDGTNALWAYIKYDPTTYTFSYMDSAGDYQAMSPVKGLYAVSPLWHIFKLVFDCESKEFVRFIVNDATYLLTDLALHSTELDTFSNLFPGVQATGTVASNGVLNIGYCIVTQNEP